MAKIKFHKFHPVIKGEKIETIARLSDETKDRLLQQKSEMMRKQGITRIKAKDVVLKQQEIENEQGFEM